MATAEGIFKSTKLDVIVPEGSLEIPPEPNAEDWLLSLASVKQREKAFFDERLLFFFTVKVPHPGPDPVDPSAPPLVLAQFLSHLQITLDAKYITVQQPQQQHHRGTLGTGRGTGRGISLAPPPRSHSYRNGPRLPPHDQPSIFPPHTPHPTPQTGESDRKYANPNAKMEGTVLESFVWGETQREDHAERSFALLWSSSENVWVAIYRLNIGVSFLRTPAADPLLSLTVSITLREKPLKMTPERKVLAALVSAAGGGKRASDAAPVAINGVDEPLEKVDVLDGLEEVNLLEGLSQSPTFGRPGSVSLTLPSVRLGASLRHNAYSLPPIQPDSPPPSRTSTSAPVSGHQRRNSTHILRKSFLKTLQTVSGFQIRMKSVFVPFVVIPGSVEDEEERREAGSEERTVVLSVELSNGSASRGPGATGFAVEGVDVTVGGEGATANLIGWGEDGFKKTDAVFPLLIGPVEQFNMLYAITFLRQSETDDVADTMRNDLTGEKISAPNGDMQRPVAIVIRGRPFDIPQTLSLHNSTSLSYPTQTFRSRWNCVLDLSSAAQDEIFSQNFDIAGPPSARDALPAPASPFPAASPKTAIHTADRVPSSFQPNSASAVAGSKRHTIGGLAERGHHVASQTPRYRASTPVINLNNKNSGPISFSMPSSPAPVKFTPALPSTAMPTTPSPPAGPRTPGGPVPPTPAYPAYPSEIVPPTPMAQSPISSVHASGGPVASVEPRRERMMNQVGMPQTPAPRMLGASFADRTTFQAAEDDGDPVVVSVGLVSPGEFAAFDRDMVYALDTFGIEIFVFNRSERTRRFEVSYPERKRRRHQVTAVESFQAPDNLGSTERQAPGILPLENRIRIGPLRPHTCQSVRMQFLALQAGVHSIHSLVLTDVETGYSKNLKSVMDVVVHETDEAN